VKSNGLFQDGDNFCAFVITELTVVSKKGVIFFIFWERKFSKDCGLYHSVHKYIYRPCMSGPSDVTLL
jgi:hypothetical protein